MLGCNLAINHKKVTSALPTIFWILNTDVGVVMGRNYVWIDTEAFTDTENWKDTGFGMS